MSERPWTPGPWAIRRGHSVVEIRTAAGLEIAATTSGAYWKNFDDEALANARLIAAAPTLYEALSECVERLLEDRRVFVHIHAVPPAFDEASIESFAAADLAEMDERIEKARAALVAAEGKQ